MSAPRAKRPDHWMVAMNRRNRSWCGLMLFATVGAHLAEAGYDLATWLLAAVQFLLYPHLLYWRAHHSRNPRRTELQNLGLDGFFFGIWAGALGFPVWITFIFLVTATVNLTVFQGRKGFLHAVACMLAGAGLDVAVGGLHLAPDTGWPATFLSIFTVCVYVMVVAANGHARALKLHETREQLRLSEQALKQQLEEISALQAQLKEQATTDPLTGLYNRRYFASTLDREMARCRRNAQPLAVVMIDIDFFKQINDSYGHQAGDEVLRALADLLRDQVRASDVACRYGGEEFIVLLPNATAATAWERAESWRAAFAATPIACGTQTAHVTLSLGIASYPSHAANQDLLIGAADSALYRAKLAGRNQTVVAHGHADLVAAPA